MTYQNYIIPAGIYSKSSTRSGAMRWISGNNVRFFNGNAQTIKGSQALSSTALTGKCRKALYFSSLLGREYIMLATSKKLYAWNDSELTNLTPYRDTGTLGTDPFSVSSGSNQVIVTDAGHGLIAGDTVYFSGATAGGGITINGEYEVTSVTDSSHYVITHSSNASSTDTTTGGSSVAYKYEITIGDDDASSGTGWGIGAYRVSGTYADSRGWGEPDPAGSDIIIEPRLWSMDNYGEDVIAAYRGGTIYYFDTSAGVSDSNRFTALTNAPQTVKFIMVDPNGGQNIIAFGAYDNVSGADNPMLVRWCETGDPTVWTESLISDAGRYQLTAGSEIMCAVAVDKQILILTDTSAYVMSPEEYPYNYSFRLVATSCGVCSPNAIVSDETGNAMWKSNNKFFMFDGAVKEVECDVYDEAFGDVSTLQKIKTHAGMNSAYKEIWFFHPSSASTEPDTLIVYDYGQKIWWTGNISRTTYIDENPLYNKPFATTSSGIMHLHEIGTSEDNTAFTKSVKCTVEIGDGQDIMFINRLIPDWKRFTGNCTINATAYKDPQATGFSIEKEISSSTQQASLRSRGRHITVEFTSTGQQDDWEMGKLRLDVVTHGEK